MTKKEAIENHRKMWNWIADEYAKYNGELVKKDEEDSLDIFILKSKYFNMNSIETIENYCFCCQYCSDYHLNCEKCPLIWVDKDGQDCIYCNGHVDMLYDIVRIESNKILVDTKLCEDVARKIANLKERS